jgi:hypothetical protein
MDEYLGTDGFYWYCRFNEILQKMISAIQKMMSAFIMSQRKLYRPRTQRMLQTARMRPCGSDDDEDGFILSLEKNTIA